jgi:hypothetical protein
LLGNRRRWHLDRKISKLSIGGLGKKVIIISPEKLL